MRLKEKTFQEGDPKMTKPYADLVAQAEQAVAEVKDAELRRVAFERILNDLLGGGAQGGKVSSTPNPTKHAPAKSATKMRGEPQSYTEKMVEDGFFKKPKRIVEVKAELENRGHHIPLTSLSGPLQKPCQKKVLRRQKQNGKIYSYSKEHRSERPEHKTPVPPTCFSAQPSVQPPCTTA